MNTASDRTLTVRVSQVRSLTPEIKAFELVHPWGGQLPGYGAGAHIDVHTPGGFRRPYSLARCAPAAGSPARYVIGVKRETASRGGSAALHEQVQPGDLLAVSSPRNSFALRSGAASHWLFAAGIGLTPLLAMAEQLAREGQDFRLCVFARSRAHLPFAEELAALGSHLRLHFDDPAEPEKLQLPALLAAAPPEAQVYLCGPAGFMQAVRSAAAGRAEENLHAEYFVAPDGAESSSRGEPFELLLLKRKLRVDVGSEQNAVQALAEIGIDIPTSCEQGLCGTCVVGWQAGPDQGKPEHRDYCLTGGERQHKVALCCCRAQGGPLRVDL
jgi:vanillate O-demethylase ferredoxin subunit